MKLLKQCFVLICVLLFPAIVFADIAFVRSFQVFSLEQPKMGSKKLQKLVRGTQVTILAKQKSWVKVRVGATEGWIYKFALSKKAPRNRVSLLNKKVDISSQARKRASTFTNAAAARGLLNKKRSLVSRREQPNFKALKELEKQNIDPKTAVQYLHED